MINNISDKLCIFLDRNGTYSEWSGWSECSLTCGGGVSQRRRDCNNPSPQGAGADCVGSDSETTACNQQQCPCKL